MFRPRGKSVLCALAIATGSLLGAQARAATVSYGETLNQSTTVTTTCSPLTISVTNISNPYGTETTSQTAGGWMLSFSPSAAFRADADNGGGAMSQETDGKIMFSLTFDTAQNIAVSLQEGGSYSVCGNADVSVTGGGFVTEADDALGTKIGTGILDTTFGSQGKWSGSADFGGFAGSYSTYNFSIDNDLFAEALGSDCPAAACISKDCFSIIITTGGGSPPSPTPLPLASLGSLGLIGAVLAFRRKLAGAISTA
jgi:hypothetical protein